MKFGNRTERANEMEGMAYVYDCTLTQALPWVSIDKSCSAKAFSGAMCGHGLTMSSQPFWATGNDLEEMIGCVIRDLHACLVRFLTARPLPHSICGARHCKPNVFIRKPDPCCHLLIFSQDARGARMRYVAFAWLPEDVVCDCMADEAFEIQFINIYAFREFLIRDFFVKFDCLRDFELIDG